MTAFPALGANDFSTASGRFSKVEYQWFRLVTLRLRNQDILADVADVTFTAVTFPTITSANAATQTGAYVQADVQSIATLANELKTDFNAAMAQLQTQNAELVTAISALNETLTALRQTPVNT